MTDNQIDRVFMALFGFPARVADKQVVQLLGGDDETLIDYLTDHWGTAEKATRRAVHKVLREDAKNGQN